MDQICVWCGLRVLLHAVLCDCDSYHPRCLREFRIWAAHQRLRAGYSVELHDEVDPCP